MRILGKIRQQIVVPAKRSASRDRFKLRSMYLTIPCLHRTASRFAAHGMTLGDSLANPANSA